MPYVPFDPSNAYSIEILRTDYAFLNDNAMDAAVTYLNAEGYLQATTADLRTEYLRKLKAERKKQIISVYHGATVDALKYANEALAEIESVCNEGKFHQIKNALT